MKHFFSLLVFFISTQALAWESNLTLPSPAPVVDEFGLLQENEKRSLAGTLQLIKEKSGVEVSVFIAASLQGREIEDFSIATAKQWGLGQKKADRGLLLVVAPKERRMRFEVGSGLEGELTDAFTGRILDNILRPYFKEGRYFQGIVYGIAAIQEKIPLGLEQKDLPKKRARSKGGIDNKFVAALVIFLFLFTAFIRVLQFIGIIPRGIGSSLGNSRHSGGWGGGGWGGGGGFGGSSGGSWGGGGGGFSGGGSSSSW